MADKFNYWITNNCYNMCRNKIENIYKLLNCAHVDALNNVCIECVFRLLTKTISNNYIIVSSLTLSALGDSCWREIVKEIATHSGKWVREVGRKWKRVEYAILGNSRGKTFCAILTKEKAVREGSKILYSKNSFTEKSFVNKIKRVIAV